MINKIFPFNRNWTSNRVLEGGKLPGNQQILFPSDKSRERICFNKLCAIFSLKNKTSSARVHILWRHPGRVVIYTNNGGVRRSWRCPHRSSRYLLKTSGEVTSRLHRGCIRASPARMHLLLPPAQHWRDFLPNSSAFRRRSCSLAKISVIRGPGPEVCDCTGCRFNGKYVNRGDIIVRLSDNDIVASLLAPILLWSINLDSLRVRSCVNV